MREVTTQKPDTISDKIGDYVGLCDAPFNGTVVGYTHDRGQWFVVVRTDTGKDEVYHPDNLLDPDAG
jgi:hypothetical protein